MKIKELKTLINEIPNSYDEKDVKITINEPSLGGRDFTKVKSCDLGFDWDSGLYINSEELISRKTNDKTLFENSRDLLMRIATGCLLKKTQSYEEITSLKILLKSGYKAEDIEKYVSLFWENSVIISSVKDVLRPK